jgi:hypothetical protein
MNIWTRIFGDGRVSPKDPDSVVLKKQNLMQEQAMGKNGFRVVDDTATYGSSTESFCALQAIENTVINTLTGEQISESNVSVPQGFLIMGHISSFSLTSGSVVAYRSVSN